MIVVVVVCLGLRANRLRLMRRRRAIFCSRRVRGDVTIGVALVVVVGGVVCVLVVGVVLVVGLEVVVVVGVGGLRANRFLLSRRKYAILRAR